MGWCGLKSVVTLALSFELVELMSEFLGIDHAAVTAYKVQAIIFVAVYFNLILQGVTIPKLTKSIFLRSSPATLSSWVDTFNDSLIQFLFCVGLGVSDVPYLFSMSPCDGGVLPPSAMMLLGPITQLGDGSLRVSVVSAQRSLSLLSVFLFPLAFHLSLYLHSPFVS